MTRCKTISKALLLMCAVALASSALAQDVVHAVAGAVTHVDKAGKTIAIKATDGSEQVFKFTERTAIRTSIETEKGAKRGALDTYFAGKEGTKVVVRYIGKGVDKTATVVDDFGKDSLKVGKGTVTHVDRAARTVSVKTEGGAEETYKLGSAAVVETDHGVVLGTRYLAKEGDKVAVHYTEEEGGKSCTFSRSSRQRPCAGVVQFPAAHGISKMRIRNFPDAHFYWRRVCRGNLCCESV